MRQSAKIPTAVVHCIWVVSSCLVVACALFGLGTTCHLLGHSSGPCPDTLPVIAFGVGGGLLLFGGLLFLRIYCGRDTKKRPAAVGEPSAGKTTTDDLATDANGETSSTLPMGSVAVTSDEDEDTFKSTQKSADVSYWIEQQKSHPEECVPLQIEGVTSREADDNSVKSEMTAL